METFEVMAVRDKAKISFVEKYTSYLVIFNHFFGSAQIISRLDNQSKFQLDVYTIFQPPH